jgi:hypothetical protein
LMIVAACIVSQRSGPSRTPIARLVVIGRSILRLCMWWREVI